MNKIFDKKLLEKKLNWQTNVSIKNISKNEETGIIEFDAIANQTGIVDSYGDVTIAGSFTETVKTDPGVPALYNHNSDQVIGTSLLSESSDGSLLAKFKINSNTQLGKEVSELTNQFKTDGVQMGVSIGYWIVDYKEAVEYEENLPNGAVWVLTEVKVVEVSITPFPANEESFIKNKKEKTELNGLEKINSILNKCSNILIENTNCNFIKSIDFTEIMKLEKVSTLDELSLKWEVDLEDIKKIKLFQKN